MVTLLTGSEDGPVVIFDEVEVACPLNMNVVTSWTRTLF
jgi:hypothetical protein